MKTGRLGRLVWCRQIPARLHSYLGGKSTTSGSFGISSTDLTETAVFKESAGRQGVQQRPTHRDFTELNLNQRDAPMKQRLIDILLFMGCRLKNA